MIHKCSIFNPNYKKIGYCPKSSAWEQSSREWKDTIDLYGTYNNKLQLGHQQLNNFSCVWWNQKCWYALTCLVDWKFVTDGCTHTHTHTHVP
jgi:hypothetical protein